MIKKHPARKVGARPRQCRPKVPGRSAFPGAQILEFGAFRDSGNFFQLFSRDFPAEFPPNRPRKQPQPSRVF